MFPLLERHIDCRPIGPRTVMTSARAKQPTRVPSLFATQFDMAVERWALSLPPHVQDAFRAEFRWFGRQHEATLDALERIWERRERAYAFDHSTGLATRRPFNDYLTSLLNERPAPGFTAVGVLFIDVDDLKRINDTAGHYAGDRAISAVGAIVREALRAQRDVDSVARVIDDAYAVGRHGGDEFVAALQLADPADIEHVAPRVKQRAEDRDRQRARGYQGPLQLTISVGAIVYELPDRAPSLAPNALAAALLSSADGLMYAAKRDGRVHVAAARVTDKLEVCGEKPLG
jgi:diguanylate cyclase (GGDEF)-like protein